MPSGQLEGMKVKGRQPEVRQMYRAGKQEERWSIICGYEIGAGDTEFEVLCADGVWRENGKDTDTHDTQQAAIDFVKKYADP